MAIYTLSLNYIDGAIHNESHLYGVFFKFSNPSCKHKAAIDKSKKLLKTYFAAAKENSDMLTWLDLMSRIEETYFEVVDVVIPDSVLDEEMYLMVAAASKPHKKVIVHSHQYWKNFQYQDDSSFINYANHKVVVLDKDEALSELIELDKIDSLTPITTNMKKEHNIWSTGLFLLISYVVILASIVIAALFLPFYSLPLVLIASIIIVSVVGAIILRYDDRLSEKSFIELMAISLRKLFLFQRASKGPDKK